MVLPFIPSPIVRLSLTRDEPANPPADGPPAARRPFRGGKGRPYPDSTMQRVRRLLETTTLSQKEIARRAGVPQATISLWHRTLGWHRPLGAPLNPTIQALWRTGPALKLTLLTRRLVAIAERMTAELEANPDTDIDRLMQALQAVRRGDYEGRRGNPRRAVEIHDANISRTPPSHFSETLTKCPNSS